MAQKTSDHSYNLLGSVALLTPNLSSSVQFYHELLGLEIHRRGAGAAHLGAGDNEILTLKEVEEAVSAGQQKARSTGLYHLAIRVPSRLELARVLQRLVEAGWPLQGFADHGVSEAVYLADPDGNGVEVYRDFPKADWPYENGRLQMVTAPLDVDGLFGELGKGNGGLHSRLHPDTVLGHVHLRVASLPESEAFYCSILGFDLVQRYGSQAVFVSAGGYHHHIGFNTWHSAGAPPPPPDVAGLLYFTVRLPGKEVLKRAIGQLQRSSQELEQLNNGFLVRDPSQIGVLLTA